MGASDTIEGAMSRPFARRTFLKGALATAPLLLMDPGRLWAKKAAPDDENNIGPSTTTEPYLIPSTEGVEFISFFTVGDSIGGYWMVGIRDVRGAFPEGS